MPAAVQKIVEEMSETVPPGRTSLDDRAREDLRWLTGLLLDADTEAGPEYDRYRQIINRELDTSSVQNELRSIYGGRRVLITGGTGCIGSVLTREILSYDPASIVCIHALDDDFERLPGVEYIEIDIRDEVGTRDVVRRIRPDVMFHCAAQRSPWLAEREVARTLQSNVVGSRSVLRAARDVDAERVIHASTGKAMRYHTSDIYAASKKMAEWLVADYASEGRPAAVARFTHVVDNAVLIGRIDEALERRDGVIRVHDPDIAFYAQSAQESAQLLALAGLSTQPNSTNTPLEGVAINSLGAPVSLLDIVLGRIKARGRCDDATIYLSGYDRGYENSNPPGLYDPMNANDLTPLVNAIEARTANAHQATGNVDRFDVALPTSRGQLDALVDRIDHACSATDATNAVAQLGHATKDLADAMFSTCPENLFTRIHAMADRANGALPTTRRPLVRMAS